MKELRRLETGEFNLLRELIEAWCGISLDGTKEYLVETRLRHLVIELECRSYREFYDLARHCSPELRDKIIDNITTNETSWFRDPVFFDTLRNAILPDLIENAILDGRRRLKVWSAACSTGQEPYSLSILLHEMERRNELQGMRADSFEIWATDICQSALTLARNARYDPISMRRGLEEVLRERYFDKDGRVSLLRDEIKKPVRFERFNLLESMGRLGRFDLVLMRNVLIYFSAESKQRVLKAVAGILRPQAVFAVGSTETLEIYTDAFDMTRSGVCTYYRAKEV
jgi:chemotaxis protein methyltransferase CheR